jgi:enoyl-CoA hydratase/carnithine racemase
MALELAPRKIRVNAIAPGHTETEGNVAAGTFEGGAGAGRAEAFLLNPQPLTARTAYEWGVVAEVVANGKALSRARELAELYLKAPEITRRNTRVHFMQPLKERIVREVGYGLSLEGASAADLVKSMQAKSEPVAQKGKSA